MAKNSFVAEVTFNQKDKTNILKNAKKLKGKNVFINDDFAHEIMELCTELWEKAKKHGDEGKTAYLNYKVVATKRRDNQGLSLFCLSRQRSFLNIEQMQNDSRN